MTEVEVKKLIAETHNLNARTVQTIIVVAGMIFGALATAVTLYVTSP